VTREGANGDQFFFSLNTFLTLEESKLKNNKAYDDPNKKEAFMTPKS